MEAFTKGGRERIGMPAHAVENSLPFMLTLQLEGDDGDNFDDTMKQQLLDQCQTICANLIAYCAIIMTNKGIYDAP